MIGRGINSHWFQIEQNFDRMSMEEYYRLNPDRRPVRFNPHGSYDIDAIIENHPNAYPTYELEEESEDDLDAYGAYSYQLSFAPARSNRYPINRSRNQAIRSSRTDAPVSRGVGTSVSRTSTTSTNRLSSVGGSEHWRTISSVENLYDVLFEEAKVNLIKQSSAGLTSEEIRKIKKTKEASAKDTCSICCSNFKTGESVSILPCTHSYHDPCILPWLKEHKTCPMCRQDVIEGLAKEALMKKTKPPAPKKKTESIVTKSTLTSKKPLSYTSRELRESITTKKLSKR